MNLPLFAALLLVGVFAIHACADEGLQVEGPVDRPDKGVKTFTITTPLLGKPSTLEILLPDKLEEGKRYRTLYVLPVEGGIGGQFGDGIAELRKLNVHNEHSLVCVTMSFDTVPWYGAHATDKTKRHADYIKSVVVPLIEKSFPTTGKPEDRLLLGFSKSGWGAVSLLLRDPDFWGSACAWDAPLMMDEKNLKFASRNHFGTPEAAAPYVPTTLVCQRAEQLAKGPIRLTIIGHDNFAKDTESFHKLLDSLQIPHRYDNTIKFKHHWNSGWVAKAVELLLAPAEERP